MTSSDTCPTPPQSATHNDPAGPTPPDSPVPSTSISTMQDPNALNPYPSLVRSQQIYLHPSAFPLECGATLPAPVPVAYKTFGTLDASKSNVIAIFHAVSGSADVSDWWAPLLGPGHSFDTRRFFIVCCNVLGSPYGSASPLTINPETGKQWGPDFPVASVRDDVRLFKHVYDHLGIKRIQFAIGGSMGGMHALEMAAELGPEYVRFVVPIASVSRLGAWGISWGEAQRQCIFADPNYQNGHYSASARPNAGLASARMQAMLTYRSHHSFEARFGRKIMVSKPQSAARVKAEAGAHVANASLKLAHNDGAAHFGQAPNETLTGAEPTHKLTAGVFSAQSYLRYQGDKFVARFDANCYIALTRKMDTHDVARGRWVGEDDEDEDDGERHWRAVRAAVKQPALVLGVESDGLFAIGEQRALAECLEDAELQVIDSPDGHDGFLLEFEQVGRHIGKFMRERAPEWFAESVGQQDGHTVGETEFSSTFGEADLVAW
ncbi:Alpha/Beta hydrolase protein [Catenaria anguillulae PL171]|uniref:Alpha/Beta hydrolase protein n=1 Tax=Catenaria anguillulae PL171 TaxID=765915 RepID=A0A1Y2HRZ0_9FUNG|nr:Alpha/Beta hydrolase protein [Catenaria anguillulae PL171]